MQRGGGIIDDNSKIRKIIDKTGFKSSGLNGQWELDTPYGGAQILDETGPDGKVFGFKEYGVSVWDANYDMIENGQTKYAKRFNTLNEAKSYAKDLLKKQYQ